MTGAQHPSLNPVRRARKAQGLGVRELAALANIDPGNLSKIENGKRSFGIKVAVELEAAMGLEPYSLVRYATDAPANLRAAVSTIPGLRDWLTLTRPVHLHPSRPSPNIALAAA